jgi:hypothetical protein
MCDCIYDEREERWYRPGEHCVLDAPTPERMIVPYGDHAKPPTLKARLDARITRAIARGELDTPEKLFRARELARLTVEIDRLLHPFFRRRKRLGSSPAELAAIARAVRAESSGDASQPLPPDVPARVQRVVVPPAPVYDDKELRQQIWRDMQR